MKKQRVRNPKTGDIFSIPIGGGIYAFGEIVFSVKNSKLCIANIFDHLSYENKYFKSLENKPILLREQIIDSLPLYSRKWDIIKTRPKYIAHRETQYYLFGSIYNDSLLDTFATDGVSIPKIRLATEEDKKKYRSQYDFDLKVDKDYRKIFDDLGKISPDGNIVGVEKPIIEDIPEQEISYINHGIVTKWNPFGRTKPKKEMILEQSVFKTGEFEVILGDYVISFIEPALIRIMDTQDYLLDKREFDFWQCFEIKESKLIDNFKKTFYTGENIRIKHYVITSANETVEVLATEKPICEEV